MQLQLIQVSGRLVQVALQSSAASNTSTSSVLLRQAQAVSQQSIDLLRLVTRYAWKTQRPRDQGRSLAVVGQRRQKGDGISLHLPPLSIQVWRQWHAGQEEALGPQACWGCYRKCRLSSGHQPNPPTLQCCPGAPWAWTEEVRRRGGLLQGPSDSQSMDTGFNRTATCNDHGRGALQAVAT